MDKDIVTTIEYRGFKVPIMHDDAGQQYWCEFDGKEIGFGSFNFDFEEDLHHIIDEKLDTIKYFKEFPGSKLEWCDNGLNDDRDIRLKYRTRTLKVYLVSREIWEISSPESRKDILNFIENQAFSDLENFIEAHK